MHILLNVIIFNWIIVKYMFNISSPKDQWQEGSGSAKTSNDFNILIVYLLSTS